MRRVAKILKHQGDQAGEETFKIILKISKLELLIFKEV